MCTFNCKALDSESYCLHLAGNGPVALPRKAAYLTATRTPRGNSLNYKPPVALQNPFLESNISKRTGRQSPNPPANGENDSANSRNRSCKATQYAAQLARAHVVSAVQLYFVFCCHCLRDCRGNHRRQPCAGSQIRKRPRLLRFRRLLGHGAATGASQQPIRRSRSAATRALRVDAAFQ